VENGLRTTTVSSAGGVHRHRDRYRADRGSVTPDGSELIFMGAKLFGGIITILIILLIIYAVIVLRSTP
jgi:hypothetical protein